MKKLTARIALLAITVFMLIQNVSAAQFLIPVGQIVGLQINQDQVTIDGFDSKLGSAAQEAGLMVGDRIIKIDELEIRCPDDIRKALQVSDGDVDISIVRNSEKKELELEPAYLLQPVQLSPLGLGWKPVLQLVLLPPSAPLQESVFQISTNRSCR